jgi:hypothetical protein
MTALDAQDRSFFYRLHPAHYGDGAWLCAFVAAWGTDAKVRRFNKSILAFGHH